MSNSKKYQGNAKEKDNKEFIKKIIKEVFQDFKKIRKIIFFDRQFFKEKYRTYSLLEKNGFLKLVNEPYYCHNPK